MRLIEYFTMWDLRVSIHPFPSALAPA